MSPIRQIVIFVSLWAVCLVGPATSAFASFGYLSDGGSYVFLDGGGGVVRYQISASSVFELDFGGRDLGSYDPSAGDELNLTGYQMFTYEKSGDNAHNGRLQWSLDTGSSGTITATSFQDFGNGINLHQNKTELIDLLAGLTAGDYILTVRPEVDATLTGNPFPQVDDTAWVAPDGLTLYQGSGDTFVPFSATFTVVSEPSFTIVMLATLLATFGEVTRRRR